MGGKQHHGPHAAGEQQGQRNRSSPATRKFGQHTIGPPLENLRRGQQCQGEAHAHHGQKQLAHQKGQRRGQGCFDHARHPATAASAQTVEQRQLPHRSPGNPRSRVQTQARCPL